MSEKLLLSPKNQTKKNNQEAGAIFHESQKPQDDKSAKKESKTQEKPTLTQIFEHKKSSDIACGAWSPRQMGLQSQKKRN
jgi:hypothetical protein